MRPDMTPLRYAGAAILAATCLRAGAVERKPVRCGTRAFTLVEVAFSLVILASAVTFTIVILGGALRDQQINRYRILAAAKAVTLLEMLSQPQEDYRAMYSIPISPNTTLSIGPQGMGGNVFNNDPGYDKEQPFSHLAKGISTIGYKPVPAMMASSRFDLERVVGSNLGGCYPVPTPIARRLDSQNDEIQSIYDRGGKLFYFDPSDRSGQANAVIAGKRNAATDDLQRLVFAVIGPPQQNLLPSHPWMAPPVKLYPYPPAHLEIAGGFNELINYSNPVALRRWTEVGGGAGQPVYRRQLKEDGYGLAGTLFALRTDRWGWTPTLGGGAAYQKYLWHSEAHARNGNYTTGRVQGEFTDASNWEWQAFLELSQLTDRAKRDALLRGEWGSPADQKSLLKIPDSPVPWDTIPTADRWSPWVVGAPEFRRLLHWHWNRIAVQLSPVDLIGPLPPPPPPADPPKPPSGSWVTPYKEEPINPWPTIEQEWTDISGQRHHQTTYVWPRPTRRVPAGPSVWQLDPPSTAPAPRFSFMGLPAPPNGLGKAKGLRGTDILYEDHEPFPGNRLEQIRLGMPSLERRVMYRTAALALWAKVKMGTSIHTAEARLLGTAEDVAAVLAADPNVADKASVLPTDQNPLLEFVPPPEKSSDIHPAQVLALNYLAHAAMQVTGYRPPFVDNQNSLNPDHLRDLHASSDAPDSKDPGKNVRKRYYRKFGQETFYLAHPMYCEKKSDFDPKIVGKDDCAANPTTQPWCETTAPSTTPAAAGSVSAESYSKGKIWSMLTDNFDRMPDRLTQGTFILDPADPLPVTIDAPDDSRLSLDGKGNGIKVRRFFEGGTFYRDHQKRGRPNAVWNSVAKRMEWEPVPNAPGPASPEKDPYAATGTKDGDKWRPGRWGPEGYGQDLDPGINAVAIPDGMNDDAVVNPNPPPYAQEGAFDCWGNQKFSWRVLAPVGKKDTPKTTDFYQLKPFAIWKLEEIADTSLWKGDQGGDAWSNDDVLCGPIEAEYVPARSIPVECDDLRMAKNAMRTCMAWVMKYTNRYPADFIVPKPANSQTAWHRPLFFADLFRNPWDSSKTGAAFRPKPERDGSKEVDWSDYPPIGWTGEAAFPALFLLGTQMSSSESLYSANNHLDSTYLNSPVRDANGNRSVPPYATGTVPKTKAEWIEQEQAKAYKDILRCGPVIMDGVSNYPPGLQEAVTGAMVLSHLHGHPQGLPALIPTWWDKTVENFSPSQIMRQPAYLPTADSLKPKWYTTANPPRLRYPLGQAPDAKGNLTLDQSHAWHFEPFKIADRCRQLVFWQVDWKSYQDSETVPSDPVDLSMAPLSLQKNNIDAPYFLSGIERGDPRRSRYNPERMLCWLNNARDRTVANPKPSHHSIYSGGWVFDSRGDLGLQYMPIGRWASAGWVTPDDSGDARGFWFYANMGRFGADRDGNGVLSWGPTPVNTRLRAREVGRFIYYDPVMPLSTRR